MNTIDDLRATLAADAAAVDLHPDAARPAAVRGRIRGIQRRRRAGAVAGVAALVAVVAIGVGSVVGDGPAAPKADPLQVAGQRVPEAVQVLDFDYRFVSSTEGEPGAEEATLDLDEADRRRVVMLAVDRLPVGATATLRDVDGTLLTRAVGPSRLDLPVPVGTAAGAVTVSVSGGAGDTVVGMALYERTDDVPEGIASDGVVFRQEAAGDLLVGGTFVDPADGVAELTVDGSLSDVAVATHCDSNGERVFMVVHIDGELALGGRCDDISSLQEDAYGGGSTFDRYDDAGPHRVRIWTTDRQFSEKVVPYDGTVVGAAAYRTVTTPVLGQPVDERIEWGGRLYELVESTGRSGRIESDRPVIVGHVAPGPRDTFLRIRPDDGRGRTSVGSAGGAVVSEMLWPGTGYDLTLIDGAGDPVAGAILVYRPVG